MSPGLRVLLLTTLTGCASAGGKTPALLVGAGEDSTRMDAPVRLQVSGLSPAETAGISLVWEEAPGGVMRSLAWFRADERGRIDLATTAPDSGSYTESDGMGLFWSMRRTAPAAAGSAGWRPPEPLRLVAELHVAGQVIARRQLVRWVRDPSVRVEDVLTSAVIGRLYIPDGDVPPVVLVLGGSEGGFDDLQAAALASRGFAALAVGYFGAAGLPDELFGIPVERVSDALRWVQGRPDVDGSRVALLGTSKGAELALLAATRLPEVRAVVLYAPTDAVQSGITREGRSRPESSWSEQGRPVPFLPQRADADFEAQFRGPPPYTLRFLYEASRRDSVALARAAIPAEQFPGALLLISGEDDAMIPATDAADAVMRRILAFRPDADVSHLQYRGAGHAILLPYLPTPPRVAGGFWRAGGTPEGYAQADQDSWQAVLSFLERTLRE